ncbi:hypothetical protein J4427_01820 [Candidatus Woesearchaeota archaeon]|nr:hypothetical protein [Candidatus Woesearchaeota archaeon]
MGKKTLKLFGGKRPITNALSFNAAWLFAGILSAGFGLYASKLLLGLSKAIGFYGKKK